MMTVARAEQSIIYDDDDDDEHKAVAGPTGKCFIDVALYHITHTGRMSLLYGVF